MEIDREHLHQLVVRALAAGPLAGLADATDSSAIVGTAAGAGLVLDHLINKAQQNRLNRGSAALDVASALRGIDPGDFAAHVASDEHVLELAAILLDAASRTTDQEHFLFLARLLADSASVNDAREVDSLAYVVNAVANLQAVHLQVLRKLAEPRPPRHENLMRYDDVTASVKPDFLKEPVRLDLMNVGLIKGFTANEINAQVKAELSISYDVPGFAAYALTPFGRDVCRRLREAGESLKDSDTG